MRSSCEASARKRRSRLSPASRSAKAASICASIAFRDRPSRPTSVRSLSGSTRRERSPAAICPATSPIRRSGRRPSRPATRRRAPSAIRIAALTTSSISARWLSVASVSPSGTATTAQVAAGDVDRGERGTVRAAAALADRDRGDRLPARSPFRSVGKCRRRQLLRRRIRSRGVGEDFAVGGAQLPVGAARQRASPAPAPAPRFARRRPPGPGPPPARTAGRRLRRPASSAGAIETGPTADSSCWSTRS